MDVPARSGVGVCEETLVIWPLGNPMIAIHIAALDEIRAATEDDAVGR